MTGDLDVGEALLSLALPRPVERCDIVIGAGVAERLPAVLERHAPAQRYILVCDDTVAGLHGETVLGHLRDAGLRADVVRLRAGEEHKTLARWSELVEELGALGAGRDGCIIALGGGVTGDLAGFAAATFARGITFVQVPTTLLAMVDASLGGKTGLDLRAGKNLVGAFHQPRLVVVDPRFLTTLPDPELRSGAAEAVKHGVIADPGYLQRLVADAPAIFERDDVALAALVAGSVRIKTGVIARDVLEAGERAVLNFGHTIGHALELLSDYRTPHGEGVAVGMVAEAMAGERAGITAPGTATRVAQALTAFGLPTRLPADAEPAAVLDAARSDKKARAGAIRYALLTRVGEVARTDAGAWTHALPDAVVTAALAACRGGNPGG